MEELSNIGLQKRFMAWANLLIWLIFWSSILVLLAWKFNIELIKHPIPGLVTMNPISALCFLCSAVALRYITLQKVTFLQRRIGYSLVLLVAITSILKIISIGFNSNWHIDNWLFADQMKLDAINNLFASMAINTALGFTFSSSSLLLLHYKTSNKLAFFQFPALLFITMAFFSSIGYLYRVPEFHTSFKLFTMPIQTALLFIFLGLAILFIQPDRGLMTTFTNNFSGNIIARTLIPATITIPVFLGILRLFFHWLLPVSTELGVSMLIMAIIFVFTTIMWRNINFINARAVHQNKTELKFEKLLEAAPDAMIIVEENGVIQLVNRQAEKMFGYQREEMIGNTIEILMPERFRGRHPGHRDNYFRSPKIRGMGEGLELFGLKKDSTEFIIEISLSPLETPEGILVSAAIRDITARKKEEEKFRSLLEAAPDAVVIVAENGVIKLVNRQTEKMFGYHREEMIRSAIEVLMPERFRGRHPGHRDNYFNSPKIRGMGEGLELFGLKKDGTEFFIEISLSPLETPDGLLVSAAIRDISDKKIIEERLKQFNKELEKEVRLKTGELVKSEKRFRGMIENNNDLVVLTDEQFKPFYRSPNFERITGWTSKELDEKGSDYFINSNDIPMVQQLQQKLLANPMNSFPVNFRFKHKNGHEIWIEGISTNLLQEAAIQGIVSNLRDVSERKEAEIKLANSKRIYETIASNIPGSVILLFDIQHRYILIEGDLLAPLEYTKDQLLDKKASDVLPSEIYSMTKQRLDRVFNGEYFTIESITNGLDIHTRYIPIRDEGQEVTLAMVVVMDITELKNTQRALAELNASLEQKVEERTHELEMVNNELEAFTYSVSHDLRAPLRIIDGFSDFALSDNKSKLDDEGVRTLNIIRSNAQRMGQLIDDLLNLSRFNRKEINMRMVDMSRLVCEIVKEQQLLNDKKMSISCDQLMPAYCDGGLFRQVWINLISNAIKYSAKKEQPQVQISSYKNDSEIIYYIKDNGAGFDMQYADKLFGVFQRLHKQTEYEGTGVGLALVKRIITRHGGKIWAEAAPDKGATFYFSLPAVKI